MLAILPAFHLPDLRDYIGETKDYNWFIATVIIPFHLKKALIDLDRIYFGFWIPDFGIKEFCRFIKRQSVAIP